MPWEHIEEGCALWNIKYNNEMRWDEKLVTKHGPPWCWTSPQMDYPGIQMDVMRFPGRGEEEMYIPTWWIARVDQTWKLDNESWTIDNRQKVDQTWKLDNESWTMDKRQKVEQTPRLYAYS